MQLGANKQYFHKSKCIYREYCSSLLVEVKNVKFVSSFNNSEQNDYIIKNINAMLIAI